MGFFSFDRRVDPIAPPWGYEKGKKLSIPYPREKLALWFDASQVHVSNGENVTQWDDLSGNGYHAGSVGLSSYATLKTNQLNGLPCVSFTTTSHLYNTSYNHPFINGRLTLFVLFKKTVYAQYGGVFCFGIPGLSDYNQQNGFSIEMNGSNINTTHRYATTCEFGVAFPASDFALYCLHKDVTPAIGYVNGVQGGSCAFSAENISPTWFEINQRAAGTPPIGNPGISSDFCEIVVFNQPLTTDEKAEVTAFIMDKWGLS